ncbi:MAG: DUF3459 domain-containing protein [Actinomycetia bacterium]|nr:DUF3459 domain-containing protein [Actinomycetes bacterium]
MGARDRSWWTGAVGYEIYIRSFADASGDGIGDLQGVNDHLEHLAWLGVDALWLTPFYPSPGADHGYDVSDYCDVNPIHGSIDDFDRLINRAHELGVRVIVDVVPNHTSDHHPWFLDASSGPDSPVRDYYIWRDPAPDGGPPNNWVSHFGGSAWTFDQASGQYYCHLFLPEQPDLNWAHPAVADEFDRILRFWCERGVDGFRIDVAHGLVKDPALRDNPQIHELHDEMGARAAFDAFEHVHDMDQDGNVAIYQGWNELVAPYGAVLLGEIGTEDQGRVARYGADGKALHQLHFLTTTIIGWDPAAWREAITGLQPMAPSGVSWVLSCHDRPRAASRFGGGELGAERALAMTTFTMILGGMPFIYQGEELGLPDGELGQGSLADPLAVRNTGTADEGRDGCRTVMPWSTGPANGFSPTGQTWLDSVDRPASLTVSGQHSIEHSTLHRYRDLFSVRHRHPALWADSLTWLDSTDTVLAARRAGAIAAVNMSDRPQTLSLPEGLWAIRFQSHLGTSTDSPQDPTASGSIEIPPESGVILTGP